METVDLSSLYDGTKAKAYQQRQFVGAEFCFPPATNLSDEWTPKEGVILSRVANSSLWEWVQATQSQILTDTAWLALETESANGAVSAYSSGDGTTTFRTPSIGTGGFARAKGKGVTDPVLLNVGFNDQIKKHKHATPFILSESNVILAAPNDSVSAPWGVVNTNREGDSGRSYTTTPSGDNVDENITFLLTSKETFEHEGETYPKGQFVRVFIYNGSDVAKGASLPSIEQLLAAASLPNILYNVDHENDPVNQLGFDGNYAVLNVGQYGYDGWLKYSATHKAQVIESGDYTPNSKYLLSYGGVKVKVIDSPASGHWLVAVPFAATKLALRESSVLFPFHPEDRERRLSKSKRRFEKGRTNWVSYNAAGTAIQRSSVNFSVEKRKKPHVIITKLSGSSVTTATPISITEGHMVVAFGSTSQGLDWYGEYAADASFTISDAGSNIEVVG